MTAHFIWNLQKHRNVQNRKIADVSQQLLETLEKWKCAEFLKHGFLKHKTRIFQIVDDVCRFIYCFVVVET